MSDHEIFSKQTNNKNEQQNDNGILGTALNAEHQVAIPEKSNFKLIIIGSVTATILASVVGIWYYNQQQFINKNIEICHESLEKKIVDNGSLTACTIGYKDGDAKSTAGLASIYYKNGDVKLALPLLNTCAEQEQINCQLLLSMLYKNGVKDVLTQNRQTSLKWLMRAQKNDSAAANYMMHIAYAYGNQDFNIERNQDKANEYLRKAVALDYPDAVFRMGYFYDKGFSGFDKDPNEALNYYEKAVKLNSQKALVPLGKLYMAMDRTDDAQKIFEKAHNEGLDEGTVLLAELYYRQLDQKLQNKAVKLLNEYFEKITDDSVTKDLELQYKAELLLCDLYLDLKEIELFVKTVDKAIEEDIPGAAYRKGMAYLYEFLIPDATEIPDISTKPAMPDAIKMAVKYLQMESKNKHEEAIIQLFELLRDFRSQEMDKLAFETAQKLNDIDKFKGSYALAYCYGNGIDTDLDITKAQELYTMIIKEDPDLDNRYTLASTLAFHYYTGKGNIIKDGKDLKLGDLFAELLLTSETEISKNLFCNLWQKFTKLYVATKDQKEIKEIQPILNNLSLIAEKYPSLLEENDDLKFNYVITKLILDPKNSKNVSIRKEQLDQLIQEKKHLPSTVYMAKQAISGKLPYSKPNKEDEEKYLTLAMEGGSGWALWRHATNLLSSDGKKEIPYDQVVNELRAAISNGFNEASLTIIKARQNSKFGKEIQNRIDNEEYYYYLLLAYRDQLLSDKDLGLINDVLETLSAEQQLNAENKLKNTPF